MRAATTLLLASALTVSASPALAGRVKAPKPGSTRIAKVRAGRMAPTRRAPAPHHSTLGVGRQRPTHAVAARPPVHHQVAPAAPARGGKPEVVLSKTARKVRNVAAVVVGSGVAAVAAGAVFTFVRVLSGFQFGGF